MLKPDSSEYPVLLFSHYVLLTLSSIIVSDSVMSVLCAPMDCSLPGHGVLQARILEWVAISFSRVYPKTNELQDCQRGSWG